MVNKMTLEEEIKKINNQLSEKEIHSGITVRYNLQTVYEKTKTLDVRAVIVRDGVEGDSFNIIKIKMDEIMKVPTEVECERDFSSDHFKQHSDIMRLPQREYQKLKLYCEAAVKVNKAKKAATMRGMATLPDGSEIHELAQPIHDLCEKIGILEDVDELYASEAEDIQEAVARLESILEKIGYGKNSFNTERYENDEIAQRLHDKYRVFNQKSHTAKGKQEIRERQAKRLMNCDESKLTPLSSSATQSTVSPTRIAFEEAKGRAVKESQRKRSSKHSTESTA